MSWMCLWSYLSKNSCVWLDYSLIGKSLDLPLRHRKCFIHLHGLGFNNADIREATKYTVSLHYFDKFSRPGPILIVNYSVLIFEPNLLEFDFYVFFCLT